MLGFSACVMEHAGDQWRLAEATCRETFWLFSALFTVTAKGQWRVLTGHMSALLPPRCFLVLVSQHKLQSLRDGHAVTTLGEVVQRGIHGGPSWRSKAPGREAVAQ